MDIKLIETHVVNLDHQLSEKGWRSPNCEFDISANGMRLWVRADHPISDSYNDKAHKIFRGEDLTQMFVEARAYIRNLPTAEAAELDEYRRALSRTIELGAKYGFDVELLRQHAEAIAENAITAA